VVNASNGDNLWSEAGAFTNMEVPPAFNRTKSFRVLCVAAFFATLWALYRDRRCQIKHEHDARLAERVGERTRIARVIFTIRCCRAFKDCCSAFKRFARCNEAPSRGRGGP